MVRLLNDWQFCNILAGPQVLEATAKAFDSTPGELAVKLFAALEAGDDAGGDSRGKRSASILVVRKGGGRNITNEPVVYLGDMSISCPPQRGLAPQESRSPELGIAPEERAVMEYHRILHELITERDKLQRAIENIEEMALVAWANFKPGVRCTRPFVTASDAVTLGSNGRKPSRGTVRNVAGTTGIYRRESSR